MAFINSINGYLWSYVLIGLLIASGVFYTLRTGFAQVFLFGDMVKLITGKLSALKRRREKSRKSNFSFPSFLY